MSEIKKTRLPRVQIYMYGFKSESLKIENTIKSLMTGPKAIRSRAFLIKIPDAQIIDLNSDSKVVACIVVVCSDFETLTAFKNLFYKDECLKNLFINFQQPAAFFSTGHT